MYSASGGSWFKTRTAELKAQNEAAGRSEHSTGKQSDHNFVLPALIAVEADGLLDGLSIGLAGWEQVNLSACLIDYAIKHGLNDSQHGFDSIRAQAIKKYPNATDKKDAVLKALDTLLAEHSAPNTYSQSRSLIEKAINAIKGI